MCSTPRPDAAASTGTRSGGRCPCPTPNCPILMGRASWQCGHVRPLPNQHHVSSVVSPPKARLSPCTVSCPTPNCSPRRRPPFEHVAHPKHLMGVDSDPTSCHLVDEGFPARVRTRLCRPGCEFTLCNSCRSSMMRVLGAQRASKVGCRGSRICRVRTLAAS